MQELLRFFWGDSLFPFVYFTENRLEHHATFDLKQTGMIQSSMFTVPKLFETLVCSSDSSPRSEQSRYVVQMEVRIKNEAFVQYNH